MLRTAEAELILPEGERLNQSMGSVMHGAVMQRLDEAWATQMHSQNIRPYTQYLTLSEGRPVWRISVMTEEAFEHLLKPAMKWNSLHLTQRGADIRIRNFQIKREETYESIARKYWVTERRIHHIDLQFLTSTSFRSDSSYIIFPDLYLLCRHWIEKWNTFSDASILKEAQLAEHLAQQMQITGYRLHMHPYSVEGRRIRAFRGQIKLGLFTHDTAAKMIAMLADFAEFSGTGIKTALGMGGTDSQISFWEDEK